MMTAGVTKPGWLLAGLLLAVSATAAVGGYRQVVDGVAIYFGVVPAELVRGHPRGHPESEMHGGAPVGESHLTIALFEDKSGARINDAEVSARITGDRGLDVRKKLEPMLIAGRLTYGNYFPLSGAGPYRIELSIRLPRMSREIRADFTWARS